MCVLQLLLAISHSQLTTAFVPEMNKMAIPAKLLNANKSFSFCASGTMIDLHDLSIPLTWTTNTISDLTAVLAILILDRLVYPIVIHRLNIRRRIAIGVMFGLLACLAAVTTEGIRTANQNSTPGISNSTAILPYCNSSTTAIINGNKFSAVYQSASIVFEATQVSVYWVVPQFLFYGVMVAFVMPGGT